MEYVLSAKEILYLCAALGYDFVYGVEDAFDSINPGDISAEIRKVHSDLEKNNYIESDFDGETSMDKDLMKVIECCTESPVVLIINVPGKSDLKKVNYYFSENTCAAAVKDNDKYVIKDYNKENLTSDIDSFLKLKSGSEFADCREVSFLIKEIDTLKKELQQGNIDKVKDYLKDKTSDTMADAIVCALSEAGDIYSVVLIDSRGPDIKIDNVTAVDTDKGVLRFKTIVTDLENAVSIIACQRDDLKSLVMKLVGSI